MPARRSSPRDPALQAFWRRLDTPGHDGAVVHRAALGWHLTGMAVFQHNGMPACLAYDVELDADWRTRVAGVRGFIGGMPFVQRIERTEAGWVQNGVLVEGLRHATDIDFGFTPATNMAQLRRIDLAIGATASFDVAWLDLDAPRLTALPQTYRRIDQGTYAYDSPNSGYRATLQMHSNGFVRDYPTLWEML